MPDGSALAYSTYLGGGLDDRADGATATYSGPNQGQASGTTGDDGRVVLLTDPVRKPQGLWCFEVTDVTKDGFVYDPDGNVVTVQCESNKEGGTNIGLSSKIGAAFVMRLYALSVVNEYVI